MSPMVLKILLHITTVIAILVILLFIQWYAGRNGMRTAASGVFTYSLPAKLFAIVPVAILPFAIVSITPSLYLRIVLFLGEAILVVYVVGLLTTRIVIKPDTLEISSAFRIHVVPLSQISRIDISETSQSYLVRQPGQKALRISFYIEGVRALISSIERGAGLECEDRNTQIDV